MDQMRGGRVAAQARRDCAAERRSSLRPLRQGGRFDTGRTLAFEHHGGSAIILDGIKLVRNANSPWRMYDMTMDRTETKDILPQVPPERIRLLVDTYHRWMAEQDVLPYDIVKARTR